MEGTRYTGDLLHKCYSKWGKRYHCSLYNSLFQAFRLQRAVFAWWGALSVLVVSELNRTQRKREEKTRGVSPAFFSLINFLIVFYYLNTWNRLSLRQKGFCCIYSLTQT